MTPPQHEILTVLPGDDVTSQILTNGQNNDTSNGKKKKSGVPKLGTGLVYHPESKRVTVSLAGRIHYRSASHTYYVLSNARRYVPKLNDRVLAVVEERVGADYYRVNIFGPHPALLSQTGFEGSTKRNKPNLQPGSLIYCRVCNVCPDMDPEVTCKVGGDDDGNSNKDGGASRKDWMTDEGTYGELKGGTTILNLSLGLSIELLRPDSIVLEALAKYAAPSMPFELAIGVNGSLWVHSNRPEHTILILNAIKNSEVMTEEQCRGMVREMVKTMKERIMDEDE